jgi:WD40 repeat protein
LSCIYYGARFIAGWGNFWLTFWLTFWLDWSYSRGLDIVEDSLKASAAGLALVDQARKRLGWNRQSTAWTQQALTSVASLKQFWRGERIQRETFIRICQAVAVDWPIVADTAPTRQALIDWGEAPEVLQFWGRTAELATLTQWIEQCKLIALLGMGGMGKTTLAVRLTEQVQSQFTYVIWRSLRNQPPLDTLLTDILRFFVTPTADLSTPTQLLTTLMTQLREHRCLIILDNTDSILSSSDGIGGSYQPGYAAYGEFWQRVGEERHQSCLLLTSREQPKEFTRLASDKVQTLQLQGLAPREGEKILTLAGLPASPDIDYEMIVTHYAGNPLALKIVASGIRDLLNSNVSAFLALMQAGSFGFSDIQDLLERHYDRLSNFEQEVVHWLAIARAPIALPDLQADLLSPESRWKLSDTLESLKRRSLLEIAPTGFTLQPSVMEYITYRLIEYICGELVNAFYALSQDELMSTGETMNQTVAGDPINRRFYPTPILRNHTLLQATAKDYIRETQVRLLVGPLLDRLRTIYEPQELAIALRQLLHCLRGKPAQKVGYLGGNLLNLLIALKVDLHNFDFADCVLWQADLRTVTLHQVNFSQADLSRSAFLETFSNVLCVAFSPNGKVIAQSDNYGWISLWEIETGKPLLSFQAHRDWCFAVAFSPDGQWLASGSLDRSIKIWSVATGHCVQTWQLHKGGISALAFSAVEPTLLASGSADKTIKLIDAITGVCRHTLAGHQGIVRSIALSPDGKTLASASLDHTVKIWQIATGKCLRTLAETDEVYTVTFLNNHIVANAGDQGLITLWNIKTGKSLIRLTGHHDRIWSLVSIPDSSRLISSSDDRTIKIWDTQSGQCLNTLAGHQNRIWSVAISPDGQTIASGSDDKTVRLWQQRGQCLRTRSGYHNSTAPIAFATQTLATFSADQTLRWWDVPMGQCVQVIPLATQTALQATLSPNHDVLATANLDCTIQLFPVPIRHEAPPVLTGDGMNLVEDGENLERDVTNLPGNTFASPVHGTQKQRLDRDLPPRVLHGHTTWVHSVIFNANGTLLASVGGDCMIRLWLVATGECLHVLAEHQNPVQSVAFHPTAEVLASGSWDQTVKLWHLGSGECLQTLVGHRDRIADILFTPDGQHLISASKDGTMRLWDWRHGRCEHIITGHQAGIVAIALSPDGRCLASASQDGTIRLWELPQTRWMATLPGQVGYDTSLIFSPDGQILAVGGEDGTCTLWDCDRLTHQPVDPARLQVFQVPRPYEGMNISAVQGLTTAQIAMLKTLGAIAWD